MRRAAAPIKPALNPCQASRRRRSGGPEKGLAHESRPVGPCVFANRAATRPHCVRRNVLCLRLTCGLRTPRARGWQAGLAPGLGPGFVTNRQVWSRRGFSGRAHVRLHHRRGGIVVTPARRRRDIADMETPAAALWWKSLALSLFMGGFWLHAAHRNASVSAWRPGWRQTAPKTFGNSFLGM